MPNFYVRHVSLQRLRESNPCSMRERHVSQPLDESAKYGAKIKRKLGDSNPRYGYPHGSLANCWFQPLTQTSLVSAPNLILRCKGSILFFNTQILRQLFFNKHKVFFNGRVNQRNTKTYSIDYQHTFNIPNIIQETVAQSLNLLSDIKRLSLMFLKCI